MRTAVLLLLLLVPAGAPAQQTSSPHTAEYCGDCHRAIYDGWKQSAHAAAMESRLFQDALKMADSEFGSEARKVWAAALAREPESKPLKATLERFIPDAK